MAQEPLDLIPLPTMPYQTRPDALPLDVEECRTAIWRNKGNITKAAATLKISSLRLRRFVSNSPRLSMEMEEAREQMMDIAEDNLVEALQDEEDTIRRDAATKFVLKELGGRRGYGASSKGISVKVPGSGSGGMVITWGDGTSFGGDNQEDQGTVIEHDG